MGWGDHETLGPPTIYARTYLAGQKLTDNDPPPDVDESLRTTAAAKRQDELADPKAMANHGSSEQMSLASISFRRTPFSALFEQWQ